MTLEKRKHRLKILGITALLLSLCYGLLFAYGWQFEGVEMSDTIMLFFSSFALCFIYGFGLGALSSCIPNKQYSYKQRYLFHALSLTAIAAIVLIILAIRMIFVTKYLYNF